MEPGCRRRRWAAAAVGLLAGVTLLLGAVVDGGLSTPTRDDLREPTSAAPTADRSAPRPTETGKDLSTWDHVLPSPPSPEPATVAWLLAVASAAAALSVAGPRHRAPALRTARHRGPPVLV